MTRRLCGLLLGGLVLVVLAAYAPAAAAKPAPPLAAKGLPFGAGAAGPEGTIPPSGDARYVALPAHGGTVVAQVDPSDGTVERSGYLSGDFTVQAVTVDRSTTGISADRSTLVLIAPRSEYLRRTTDLAILDATRLELRSAVTLRGNFDLDAVSPDGSLVYLIQYTNPGDPTDYLVRAYDVRRARLLSKPVVDPEDRGERMTGFPITRVTSPDGRWAYTLYDGGRGQPFVHALDTVRHTAVCVELDSLQLPRGSKRLEMEISSDGSRISILSGSSVPQPTPVGFVTTRTLDVTPAPSDPAAATSTAGDDPGAGADWALYAAIVLVPTAALGLTRRHRRTRDEPKRGG